MATLVGTVISVSLDGDVARAGGGAPYKGWELIFKSSDGKVQSIAKPVQSLKFNAALKNQLAELKPNDVFTLTQEKNAAGFNEVKSIIKGADTSAQLPEKGNPVASAPARTAPSTYETKEERAVKQRLIVRQSSLSQAVQVLSIGAKTAPSQGDIFKLADTFAEFIYKADANQSILDLEDDIPL